MALPENGMAHQLQVLIKAKYSVIGIVSKEEFRVERTIRVVAEALKFQVRFWSVTKGLTDDNGTVLNDVREAGQALETVQELKERAIVVFRDCHHYFQDPVLLRHLRDTGRVLKATQKSQARVVILLAPALPLPVDLEADVALLQWPLPNRGELERIVQETIQNVPEVLQKALKTVDHERVVAAALGLTSEEAANAFARSLVERKTLDPVEILNEKKQIVARTGVLEWLEPAPGGLADVGGLEALKDWIRQRQEAFTAEARAYGLPTPKGIFVAGQPGTGKTLLAKAIAGEWGMPPLRLNIAAMQGSLHGQSEANLRRAFETAELVAPCIVLIDEIDKMVGSGHSINEVENRVTGELMTWLQERKSEVFLVGTANDLDVINERQPALLRKGRWDEVFFVDLPNDAERRSIFRVHLRKRAIPEAAVDLETLTLMTAAFSGAEIEAVVKDAMFRAFADGKRKVRTEDVVAEITRTVPLSKSAKGRIDGLRKWAEGRARWASNPLVAEAGGREIEVE